MVEFKLSEDLKQKHFWRACTAEVIGTAILVLVGCGSILLANSPDPVTSSSDIMRISFTFGMTVSCLVWTLGPVSGAHLNPAVSFSMCCIGRISLIRALMFTVSQCAGALIGSGLLYAIVPWQKRGNLGSNGLANGTEIGQGFALEAILVFILVMTICASVDEGRRDHGKGRAVVPLTIGTTITLLNLMGIPYSGASLNPARAFGPAVISGTWDAHWIYWIGPIVGGCCGSMVYQFAFSSMLHPEMLMRQPSVAMPSSAQQARHAELHGEHYAVNVAKSDASMISHTYMQPPPQQI